MNNIIERITIEAKNMLTIRNPEQKVEFIDVDLKIGTGFQTDDTLVYIAPFELETCKFHKIKNEIIQYIFYILQTLNIKKCVLIFDTIAPLANDIIKTHSIYSIQTFYYKHLLFNPIKHKYVPQHILVSEEEVNIKKSPEQTLKDVLPHILSDDKIVKYYDWKIGDIIKIIRSDSIYYRIVV